jgi:hypothetical protein
MVKRLVIAGGIAMAGLDGNDIRPQVSEELDTENAFCITQIQDAVACERPGSGDWNLFHATLVWFLILARIPADRP